MEDYNIRSACVEDLTLLAPIEQSAVILFQHTPYPLWVSAEPLPLEFVQQRFQVGQVWVAFLSEEEYERRLRIPRFLFVVARKLIWFDVRQ